MASSYLFIKQRIVSHPMELVASESTAPVSSPAIAVLRSIEAAWTQIARRRLLSCVLIVALSLTVRLALLPVYPKPEPVLTDEFSYVLGGETLAKGRLANPTHPMWRFFETIHVNMQPTYVSKYPPGNSTFLALGIRLFGHPWYGVLIGVALMCGCICWMLQGWLPPKYALLGGLFAVLWLGVAHNRWIDSYFGPAVGTLGGALVFGALPRLARNGKASAACAAAIGIAILANSRPFEGGVLVLLTFGALLWWTRGNFSVWLRPAVVLPLAIILLSTAGAMAYYNFKTTGSPTTLPHSVNAHAYFLAPAFWIMPPYTPEHRVYRDPSWRDYMERDFMGYKKVRHDPTHLVAEMCSIAIPMLVGQGAGLALVFLIACAIPLAAAIPRLRLAFVILILFSSAMLLNRYAAPQYLAPGVAVLFVVAMFGLRLLRCVRLGRQHIGQALVASIIGLAGSLFFVDSAQTIYNSTHSSVATTPVAFRRQITARLASEPGMQLVLVRYAANHSPYDEILYNGPDIDAQKIVWAYDLGPEADRPLLDYYRNRKVWLVQPDGPRPTLEPYSAGQASR
jgi:hypothetical protein